MKRLKKPRFLLVYPLVVACVIFARTTELRLLMGIVLLGAGIGLRLWANGYVGHRKVNWTEASQGQAKIGRLITGGPYAYARHPLYLGSLIIGVGFIVIVGQFLFGGLALGIMYLVYQRKMAEEEAVLLHEWGTAFTQYQRRVPQLFPGRRRYAPRSGQWSWQGVAASKELRTVAWVVVFVIALYFREELVQRREALFGTHTVKRAILLGILVILMLSDGIFELVRRWKRRRSIRAGVAPPRRTAAGTPSSSLLGADGLARATRPWWYGVRRSKTAAS